MRLKEAFEPLMEGLSSILYHGTKLQASVKILQKDSIRLSGSMIDRKEANLSNGAPFYLSTARSKMGSFSRAKPVIFQLDGSALGRKNKGAPVSFYADNNMMDEMEDRIFSSSPTIERFSQYITRIDVNMELATRETNSTLIIKELIKFSKIKRIPIVLFENTAATITNNIQETIPVSSF